MVSVEILSVGRELLIGKTLNTNAHWIGGRLASMGSMISRMITVTDSVDEISFSLREILERRPDFTLVLGGLGPTPDDLTLRGVARALNRKLRVNQEAIRMIRERYRKVWKGEVELTPARRKMATLPERATPLPNGAGTAPGVRLEERGTAIICLPGVPKEMRTIFRTSVEREIQQKIGKMYTRTTILNLEKIFESTLAPILKETIRMYPGVYIKSHPKGLRNGISRLELDVVVSSERERETNVLSKEIVSHLSRKIISGGGVIKSSKEM